MACAQAYLGVLNSCTIRSKMEQALRSPVSCFHKQTSLKLLNPMRTCATSSSSSSSSSPPPSPNTSQENTQPAHPTSAPLHQQQRRKNGSSLALSAALPTSLSLLDSWDPFRVGTRSLMQMMDVMDRLLPEVSTPSSSTMDLAYMRAPWDAIEDEDSYHVRIDLPGFGKDEVKVYVEDGLLAVNAQHNKDDNDPQRRRSLRIRDSYVTKISLPKNIEVSKLSAKLNNGVLEIFIPKSKIEKQHIDVKLE